MVKACRLVSRDDQYVAATITEIVELSKSNLLSNPTSKRGMTCDVKFV